jgi:ribosome-associated toxin RatA of RatAB toxin-antitoxin module
LKVSRHALIPYSDRQMFDLVLDVARYPEFLPWCSGGEVLEMGDIHQLARLVIRKGSLMQSFTTRNELIRPAEIRLNLVEGPFRSLTGAWRFQALSGNASKVMLDLSFEPAGAIHGLAIGSVFGQAANTMVDLFCRRALELYGSPCNV